MYPVINASGDTPCMFPREDLTVSSKACRANRLPSNVACVTPARAWTTGITTDVTTPPIGDSVGASVGVPLVGSGVGLPADMVGTTVGGTEGRSDMAGTVVGLCVRGISVGLVDGNDVSADVCAAVG
jgi:hypothetical protein